MANLRDTYVRWRGLDWDPGIPIHQRHLILWKKWREFPQADFLNPKHEHCLEACRLLFTKEQLDINPWFERSCKAWTEETFLIEWGCAGSGKSLSVGLFTLLDYLTDPDATFALLASTTKDMLQRRSFASVVKYLQYLKTNRKFHVPFKSLTQPLCVLPESAGDASDAQCVILGVAVQQGTTEQARQNLQGVHTRYVRLILDELTGLRPAAMDARQNLAQCFDFKLVGMCNPESLYDQAGLYSVPIGGWTSITDDSEEWQTEYGKVIRFDAFKSPGIKEPLRYPYLPTQASIDRILKENRGNVDAPGVWTFLKAMVPPQSAERTVLTPAMIKTYNMQDRTVWKEMYRKLAGLDPAFTSGGDAPTLKTAMLGYDQRGVLTLCYDKTFTLKIEASSPVPVLKQLVDQTLRILDAEDIPLGHLGVDDSGTQSVADALEMIRGVGLYRCNFGSKPPDVPVSVVSSTSAQEKYRDMVTWMYFLVSEFGQFGQIRGLDDEAARQFCLRRVREKQKPLQLETKYDAKKRTKRSPDDADACAIVAAVARMVLGVAPGATEWQSQAGAPPASGPVTSYLSPDLLKTYNNLSTTYGRRF